MEVTFILFLLIFDKTLLYKYQFYISIFTATSLSFSILIKTLDINIILYTRKNVAINFLNVFSEKNSSSSSDIK